MATLRNKILKDTAILNTSLLIGQVLLTLQSLIVMRFLEPSAYGMWLGLNIILVYAGYLHLGLDHGMGLRLPYYQGQGNTQRVTNIQDAVYTAWTGVAMLAAIGVMGYALLVPQPSNLQRWGLFIAAGLIVFEQQIRFMARWQSSARKDFVLCSLVAIFRSVLSFCLVVPLAYLLNVNGVMIGALLVAGITAAAWWVKTSYRPGWQFSREVLWETLRIGFPILLAVLGGGLIETVDRLLILNMLGTTSLGYYGVTSLGGSQIYHLLAQAGSAMSPHMVEDMGKHGDSPLAMEKYLVKPTLIFAYVAAIAIIGLTLAIPLLVQVVLPRYRPGLSAFYLFVPGFFFLSLILSANNILNLILIARRRQRWVVYIQAVALAIEIICGVLFIRMGWDIAGVALASTLAYAFYGLTILIAATVYVIPDQQHRLSFWADVLTPFASIVAVTAFVQWTGSRGIPHHVVLRAAVQLAVCAILCLSMIAWLNRRVEIIKEMSPLLQAVQKRIGLPITKP
ncbi:MAG: oligosaccharide flippase family protein [Thermoflexales bacterium]|nr:oligosaccharide flippase family protein [Thermoflexales bacterium]